MATERSEAGDATSSPQMSSAAYIHLSCDILAACTTHAPAPLPSPPPPTYGREGAEVRREHVREALRDGEHAGSQYLEAAIVHAVRFDR